MSVFSEWFGSGLKMKRWLFMVLIGTVMLSYGFARVFTSKELNFLNLIIYALLFIFGFVFIITGFMMAQRRMLKAIAESNANQNQKNLNIKRLLYDKKMLDKNIKIVVIGDGVGTSSVLRGLKLFSNNITAVVNVINKGNVDLINGIDVTGIKRAMTSLAENENEFLTFMNYKNLCGDLAFKNSGDILIQSLLNLHNGNLSEAVRHMSKIMNIKGNIIPATTDNIDFGAIFNDGTRAKNREEFIKKLNENNNGIEKLFLVPERCEPALDVIRSIKEADVIIIGPGSLYMGILPILLIREISDAIKKSKAAKIFVSNIMTESKQTDNFSVSDYIHVIEEHIGKGLFDYVIVSDSDIMPEYIRRYNQYGSDVVEIDRSVLKNMDLNLIIDDFTTVDETNTIHHDPVKLAKAIVKIVCDNMVLNNNQSTLEYYTAKTKMAGINKKHKKKNILFRNVKVINTSKKTNRK